MSLATVDGVVSGLPVWRTGAGGAKGFGAGQVHWVENVPTVEYSESSWDDEVDSEGPLVLIAVEVAFDAMLKVVDSLATNGYIFGVETDEVGCTFQYQAIDGVVAVD